MQTFFLTAILTAASPLSSSHAFVQEEPLGVRMIVVSNRTDAASIRTQIESGVPFDAIARASSTDVSRLRGGFVGVLFLSDLGRDFQAGIAGLATDELSAVLPLGADFALFDVLSDAEVAWYQVMDDGRRLLDAGRYTEARAAFRQAAERAEAWEGDTRLALSLAGLATTHLRESRYDRAEPLFRRALGIQQQVADQLAGPNLDLLQSLNDLAGTVYRRGGDLAEVESLFSRSLAISRDAFGGDSVETATAMNNLGLVLRDRGRLDEAVTLFTEALETFEQTRGPAHPSVLATLDALAETHRLRGDLDDAERRARRALEIVETSVGGSDPSIAAPIARVADVLADQGRTPEAIELHGRALSTRWHRGVDVAPLLDAFVDAMFAARFPESEREEALGDLSRALAAANEELLSALGQLFLAARFDRAASGVLRHAVDRFPDSWQARYRLAEAYAEMESFEEALGVFDSIDPASAREESTRLRRMADMMASLSRFDDAFGLYATAIESDAENVDAWLGQADLFLYVGDDDEAEHSYEAVLARDPENVAALAALADIRLLDGRLDDAVSLGRRAIGFDDSKREAHYTVAQALLRQGLTDGGQASLARYRDLLDAASSEDRREREIASIVAGTALLEPAAALEALRAGAETYPDSNRVLLDLGLVEMRLGNVASAIEVLETRRDRDVVGDFLVHRALEDAYRIAGRDADARRAHLAFLKAIGQALEAAARV